MHYQRGPFDDPKSYREAGHRLDEIDRMLQLLAIVAKEPPVVFEAEPVRDEKLKVLKALRGIPRNRSANGPCAASTGPA